MFLRLLSINLVYFIWQYMLDRRLGIERKSIKTKINTYLKLDSVQVRMTYQLIKPHSSNFQLNYFDLCLRNETDVC